MSNDTIIFLLAFVIIISPIPFVILVLTIIPKIIIMVKQRFDRQGIHVHKKATYNQTERNNTSGKNQNSSMIFCPNCRKNITQNLNYSSDDKCFCCFCGIILTPKEEPINRVYEEKQSDRIRRKNQERERQQREQERRERERQERSKQTEEELERQKNKNQEQQERKKGENSKNEVDLPYIRANWYSILGVSKDASSEDIKRAYRKRMSEYHPDKVSQLGDKLKELAKVESQKINAAYQYAQSTGFV